MFSDEVSLQHQVISSFSLTVWYGFPNLAGNEGKKQLLSVLGWQLNISSLQLIWNELNAKHDVKYLFTNRLCQDRLENFFSDKYIKVGTGIIQIHCNLILHTDKLL